MMSHLVISLITILLLVGCTASQVAMRPDSANVQVGSNPPGSDYIQVGPITAKHGGGCGYFGSKGDFEGAMTILRNKAAERGANYVQILMRQDEHLDGVCLDRGYAIDGYAYKKSQ